MATPPQQSTSEVNDPTTHASRSVGRAERERTCHWHMAWLMPGSYLRVRLVIKRREEERRRIF